MFTLNYYSIEFRNSVHSKVQNEYRELMASWSRKIDTHIKHSADARQLSAHALTDKREKDSIMDTFMREHEVGRAERLCVMGGVI